MLRDEFTRTGNKLFRWRSEFPLLVLALVLLDLYLEPPLCFGGDVEDIWLGICAAVASVGELIRIHAVGHVPKGTSARTNTAPRGAMLNTTGFYSIVRHPLYLGNFLMWMGLTLYVR